MTDEIIKESIKKMLNMGMKDDEIIGSLIDAGLDYNYAIDMLNEVKGKKTQKKEKSKEIIKNKNQDNFENKSLGVWQEGVLTLINQKLETIESKEKELEDKINKKIIEITSTELKKMKVILDSQRTLLITKVNSSLDEKAKEIETKLNQELELIKKLNAETAKKIQDLEINYEKMKDLEASLTSMIEEFTKIRDNSKEIINQLQKDFEEKATNLLNKYETKYEEIDVKLNNTLNLASKIVESLVSATKKKLDNYYDEKAANAALEIQKKIVEKLKQSKALEKLDEISKLTSNLEEKIDVKIADSLSKINLKKYDDSIIDLNKRLGELEKRLNNQSVDSNIEQRLEELELFKEQYAKLVKKLESKVNKK